MFQQLTCPVQHYAWGERASNGTTPYIPQLLQQAAGDLPWAELWIGAHPDAPATLQENGQSIALSDYIAASPRATLGDTIVNSGTTALPFLLKILCCSQALSIQSHPDTAMAIRLHAQNPLEFPDANHKPEILWALSPFRLMAGFRPVKDAFADICAFQALAPWRNAVPRTPTHANLCAYLLHADKTAVTRMAQALLKEKHPENKAWQLFQLLSEKYPGDCGTFFAFLLNQIELRPGQAVYIRPNIPHAYLCGEGVECMANSNNVIRAGLTPKTVNKELLLETLDFTPQCPDDILAVSSSTTGFDFTCGKDFHIRILDQAGNTFVCPNGKPGVFLVLKGQVRLAAGRNVCTALPGSAWFKAASVTNASITPMIQNTLAVWVDA